MNSTGSLPTLTRTWQVSLRRGRSFFVLQSLFWHIGNAVSERTDWWTLTCKCVQGGAEHTTVQAFNSVGEAVLSWAEFIGCLFSMRWTCWGFAVLSQKLLWLGVPVSFTARHSERLGVFPSMHQSCFILEAPLGFQASFWRYPVTVFNFRLGNKSIIF